MYGAMNPSRDVVISGCSGGGKSSLIVELSRRGYPTVPEPGRRIVQEELRGDGGALPWVNLAAFAKRAIAIASQDRESKIDTGCWRFFDRGLVDAAVALEHSSARSAKSVMAAFEPYHRQVFLTPPWPEIYANDAERPQPFGEAVAEYERLAVAYRELGYDPILLPESSVSERATFVLDRLE
jgi:predicted ATPase